jgi:hypothetical protein
VVANVELRTIGSASMARRVPVTHDLSNRKPTTGPDSPMNDRHLSMTGETA